MRDRLLSAVARSYLRKPDLAAFLESRFPDLASVWAAARNELAFRVGSERLPRLTTLNVELTSRCNAACTYCDVNRALGRPNRDLDPSVLAGLIERTPGLQVLLPFQWGEPLLYAPLDDALALARARRVRSYVTTNGLLLDAARFRRLAHAGLTRLTISLDGSPESHRERRGYDQAAVLARLAEARAVQQRERLATRLDVSMVVDEGVAHELPGFRARLQPLCDRVQFLPRMIQAPRTTACREPSRGLMVVLSDGTVTTCCADVRGQLALGRIATDGTGREEPHRLYAGDAWRALRRAHRTGALPAPCSTCGECAVPGVSGRFT